MVVTANTLPFTVVEAAVIWNNTYPPMLKSHIGVKTSHNLLDDVTSGIYFLSFPGRILAKGKT
jgi:hypothetical protein